MQIKKIRVKLEDNDEKEILTKNIIRIHLVKTGLYLNYWEIKNYPTIKCSKD